MLGLALLLAVSAHAGWQDRTKGYLDKGKEKAAGSSPSKTSGALDEKTAAAGLKEALTIGTRKAVDAVSRQDGYFGNPKIKIPLPEKLQKSERMLRKAGLSKYVDQFVLTMNRAAEKAAPVAVDIFIGAVKEMTIADAIGILRGADTAATEYFRSKTHDRLYGAFKPPVSKAVQEVGVTRSYQQLIDNGKKMHVVKDQSVDLDHHVTSKALDGLFYMVGEEEKKIRKDPVARVTDLLKNVFGK
jgi:hypothetical protein